MFETDADLTGPLSYREGLCKYKGLVVKSMGTVRTSSDEGGDVAVGGYAAGGDFLDGRVDGVEEGGRFVGARHWRADDDGKPVHIS